MFLHANNASQNEYETAVIVSEDIYVMMNFYKCYRAMVRCKVNCLIIENTDVDKSKRDKFAEDARQYLYLAHEYARRFDRPILWVFCGVPASGKSTLASKLARILSIEVHNSDRLRKTLHGIDVFTCSSEPTDQGLYAPEVKEKVYAYLFELARKAIREGRSVILDAAFSAPTHRSTLRHLTDSCGARILFVECQAPDEIILQRLRQRETTPSVSDARETHFAFLKSRFSPITELSDMQHIVLNTTQSQTACVRQLLAATYFDDLSSEAIRDKN